MSIDFTQFTAAGWALLAPLVFCTVAALAAGLMGAAPVRYRPGAVAAGWLLASGPLAAMGVVLWHLGQVQQDGALVAAAQWLPTLGLQVSLYLDALAALFALLVTGIGTLVVIYTGYYFRAWRFFCYILLFMVSMLGLVLAGDTMTLFIFWEATSITSFLLIGYKYKDEEARYGAFKSLLITGGGGIFLLAGLLMMQWVTGGGDFATMLSSGEALRQSPWYAVILAFIAIGAFTKSAQVPFHVWLPDAMAAPTPASAYLHSATMVKAGIYLMARFNPVLGGTEAWFWLLGVAGLLTMVIGAWLGLRQRDLKGLLAYSTVSQLGVLMMLIGHGTEAAYKALIVGITAHALYKGALFLVVGIVDHETGTRDLRRLGGLGRAMPLTFAVAVVAGLSMAGLPPLFGFLAKETLLMTIAGPGVEAVTDVIFIGLTVLAGGFIVTQALILVYDTFLGQVRIQLHPHRVPRGMVLAPAIPAVMSLLIGIMGEQAGLAPLLAVAAGRVFGSEVYFSLALWHGINLPLALSGLAVALGVVVFGVRGRIRPEEAPAGPGLFNGLYGGCVRLVDFGAWCATRTQNGSLRMYLGIILLSVAGLLALIGQLPWTPVRELPTLGWGAGQWLRAFALLLAVSAAAASMLLRLDLMAIVALGASGLGVALVFATEPAPDVALVMIVVDILTVVILILALIRVPQKELERAARLTFRQTWGGLTRDALIGFAAAVAMTAICLTTLQTRPRQSAVTPFYEEFALALTGSYDIVGAILIDFRAIDTLIEIAVFAMAGAGVYTLLRFASRKAGDRDPLEQPTPQLLPWHLLHGVAGARTSPLLRGGAYVVLPIAMLLAAVHVLFGHYRPGDGFTAGVILSLGVGLWHVVLGYHETKRRLRWLRPATLIGSGLVLALAGGLLGLAVNQWFLSPVDLGRTLGLPAIAGFIGVTTALLFDLAIALVVLGGASFMIETLGRPREADLESILKLREIAELERRGQASPYEGLPIAKETR